MDDEKLILLVQERDEIYNKYNPYFKFVEKKQEAWSEIASEMGMLAEDCKRRWTCLRDRFSREIKRVEQAAADDPTPLWPFFELMEFVKPFISARPIRGSKFPRLNRKSLFEYKRPRPSSEVTPNAPQPSPTPTLVIKGSLPASPAPSASQVDSPGECNEFRHVFDDPLKETPVPPKEVVNSISDVDKSFCEAVEALKQACALNKARHANPAVHAFGEMIVSTICSMNARNQLKAMQQVTDMVMRIKLEEDELLEEISYSTL